MTIEVQRRGLTLGMLDTHSRKYPGHTLFQIMACIKKDGFIVKFPNPTDIQRLARVHLESEYEEPEHRGVQSFSFLIKSHVPPEYREIFLRAVLRRTRLEHAPKKRAS